MPTSHPTVRSIAAALGLSRSTVSNALRRQPSVNATTRERVLQAAAAMGYARHPFAAQVMSQLRRGPSKKELGTLGVLELDESERPQGATPFNADLVAGARARAAAMGFAVTQWNFGPANDVSLKRIDQILKWRGIEGLLLLPTWTEPDFRDLNWTRLTGIYVDYSIRQPALHTLCSDHFRTLFNALEKARQLGYRRPGFAVSQRENARLDGRWCGAYLGYLHDHPEMTALAPLVVDEVKPENFVPWFKKTRPDIVITHWVGAPEQMRAAGAEIPRTHGYICLNLLLAPPHFSGFSLQPKVLGERAVELLISQLAHDERGYPALPSITQVPSCWLEGTTVKARI